MDNGPTVGWIPRWRGTLLLPKGSSLTARHRVRWESYDSRKREGGGGSEANGRTRCGFEVVGASRASSAEQRELSSISLRSLFSLSIRLCPSIPWHAYIYTRIRSVDWDALGKAIIVPVSWPYKSYLNELTRTRNVNTWCFRIHSISGGSMTPRWGIDGSY